MAQERRPEPEPMRTNDTMVPAYGTAAWLVALVVLVIIGLPDGYHWWYWTCVAGIAIGLFGVWYMPRVQRTRAREIARGRERSRGQDQQSDQ